MSVVPPSTFPLKQLAGQYYQEEIQDPMAVFQPEAGPIRISRKFTAQFRQWSFREYMTDDEYTACLDFYSDDAKAGAETVQLTHPRRGTTVLARFAAPPKALLYKPGAWQVDLVFTILPDANGL